MAVDRHREQNRNQTVAALPARFMDAAEATGPDPADTAIPPRVPSSLTASCGSPPLARRHSSLRSTTGWARWSSGTASSDSTPGRTNETTGGS